MNIQELETFKDLFSDIKYKHKYSGHKLPLRPFNGLGEIINEETCYKEIIEQLGKPEVDQTDDRGNRTIRYDKSGLSFKFLNNFNDSNKNPIVSFITIRKPFVDKIHSGIYPGLGKKQVHDLMNDTPSEVVGMHETWKNDDDKCMKFFYDNSERLESIIIY